MVISACVTVGMLLPFKLKCRSPSASELRLLWGLDERILLALEYTWRDKERKIWPTAQIWVRGCHGFNYLNRASTMAPNGSLTADPQKGSWAFNSNVAGSSLADVNFSWHAARPSPLPATVLSSRNSSHWEQEKSRAARGSTAAEHVLVPNGFLLWSLQGMSSATLIQVWCLKPFHSDWRARPRLFARVDFCKTSLRNKLAGVDFGALVLATEISF